MPFSLIIAFFLLAAGVVLISAFVVNLLIKRWENAQKKQAEETTEKFEQMFIFLNQKVLIFLSPIVAVVAGVLIFVITKKWWGALIAFAVAAVLPTWIVGIADRRRRAKFVSQLVDGLMVMNSCLKGGLTLTQSFEVLAEEVTPPLGHEISLLNREIKVGVTLEEALLRLERRMPSEEITLVVSAILVARETGGDLTKVFSRLVETIRDRIKLRELVTTLTLQARLQAIIISLLGPVFFFVVRKIRPDHFDIMWKNDLGRLLLGVALLLQIIGIILIIIFGKIEI